MKRIAIFFFVLCLFLVAFRGQAFAKEGTLLVFFGTSYPSAKKSIDALEAVYQKAYAEKGPVLIAYTSDIIRKKLAKEQRPVLSVAKAMDTLAKKGVTKLTVQSFHIAPAQEYAQLERMVIKNLTKYPERFKEVKVGNPLLVSKKDLDETVHATLSAIPKERKKDEAVLFMGHGNNHGHGDIALWALAKSLKKHDKNVWLACVEGALDFDTVLAKLKKNKVKTVWLLPFMITAGDHAMNDLAGKEDDSWASQLEAAGIKTKAHLIGLGENAHIQAIFLRHTEEATTDLASTGKSDD